jgi:hypothetical protein
VSRAVDAVVAELLAHAGHEERFVHPALARCAPDLVAELEAAHVALDARLDALRATARSFADAAPEDANALHRALSSFTAAYLAHLEVEEGTALPALWARCSDEDLLGVLAAFRASRSDAEHRAGVLAQLPTLNPLERAAMLGSLPAATAGTC